jgi:uncharacterized protein (TIGR00251 family)
LAKGRDGLFVMRIKVKVKPSAKQQKIEERLDGSWLIHLKSAPIEGKANQELIKLLAKHFQVAQGDIFIKTGLNSRDKIIEIDNIPV